MSLNKAKKTNSALLLLSALSAPLLSLILLSLIFWFQRDFWAFSSGWLVFPHSLDAFGMLEALLSGSRFVLPSSLLGTYLSAITFSPTFFFLVSFLWATQVFPGSKMFALFSAFAIACILLPSGIPGGSPYSILGIATSLIFLTPLFKQSRPFKRWLFLTIGTLLSLPIGSLRPLLFWMAFSLSVSESIHFSLIQRLSPSRRQRLEKTRFVLETLGLLALSVWVLITLRNSSIGQASLGPSPYYWIAFINAALVGLNAYCRPWDSSLWLGLATFSLSPLLFNNLDWANGVLMIWLVLSLLWILVESLSKDLVTAAKALFLSSTFISALIIGGWLVSSYKTEPQLDPNWGSAVKDLSTREGGSLIIGNGLQLAGTFVKAPIVVNPQLHFTQTEDSWIKFMRDENLSWILIDIPHVKKIWEETIQKKNKKLPAEAINKTFLAHLVLYRGKEVKTSTLKIKALENFEIIDSKSLPSRFLLVRLKGTAKPLSE